jgi:hypothetical protein
VKNRRLLENDILCHVLIEQIEQNKYTIAQNRVMFDLPILDHVSQYIKDGHISFFPSNLVVPETNGFSEIDFAKMRKELRDLEEIASMDGAGEYGFSMLIIEMKEKFDALLTMSTNTIENIKIQTEEIQTEEIQTEEIQTEEIQTEEIHTEEIHTEEIHTEKIQTEEIQTEEIHTEEIHTEEIHTEEIQTKIENVIQELILFDNENITIQKMEEEEKIDIEKLSGSRAIYNHYSKDKNVYDFYLLNNIFLPSNNSKYNHIIPSYENIELLYQEKPNKVPDKIDEIRNQVSALSITIQNIAKYSHQIEEICKELHKIYEKFPI